MLGNPARQCARAPYGRQKVLHAYTENPYPSGSFRTSVEDSQHFTAVCLAPQSPSPVLARSIRGSVGVDADPTDSSENTLQCRCSTTPRTLRSYNVGPPSYKVGL